MCERTDEKSGLKFVIKLNTVSKDAESEVENALTVAEKVTSRYPEVGIDIELDIRAI